ncbi:MAG: tellurite resistance TerB family protein [Acidobacteria bacterium]|jgi:uncharacterized membrane protein YebE (DUF533 family)|nr:tellurite resistance TerB family protein [Acidobacteriota bacterium]
MDLERLIGSVISGAMGAKGKKGRKAYGYLAGGRRSTGGLGSLITPGTLLGAAGLAWGLFEILKKQQGGAGPSAAPGGAPGPAAPPSQPLATGGLAGPPPLPGETPPVPASGAAATLPPEALRLVRLAISAARADGTLSPNERGILLEHARAADAEALVRQELDQPRPLAEIVAGVHDAAAREQMYGLAYGIVRADEGVSGAERIFLAQLAHRLELDGPQVAQLEAAAAAAIDAQPDTP